jgi:peptide/nickel transport system permease protein
MMRHDDRGPKSVQSTWLQAGRIGLRIFVLLLLTGLAATALVVLAPGYGIDERQLDPRYSSIEAQSPVRPSVAAQYLSCLKGFVQGDLGISQTFNRPVSDLIRERLHVTAEAVSKGLAAGWLVTLVACTLGLCRRGRPVRILVLWAGAALLCVPSALLAFFAVALQLPPAVAIAIVAFPRLHRYMDAILQAVAERSHVVAAHARGVAMHRVILNHILRPGLGEVAVLAGVSLNVALAAAIPIEVLCGYPGLGQLALLGALGRDVPLVVSTTLCVAFVSVTANQLATAFAQRLDRSSG